MMTGYETHNIYHILQNCACGSLNSSTRQLTSTQMYYVIVHTLTTRSGIEPAFPIHTFAMIILLMLPDATTSFPLSLLVVVLCMLHDCVVLHVYSHYIDRMHGLY